MILPTFSKGEDQALDFSKARAADIFNEQIAPTFNRVESQLNLATEQADLDDENALATERRDALQEEFTSGLARMEAEDDAFLAQQGGPASTLFNQGGQDPGFALGPVAQPPTQDAGASLPVINKGKFSSSQRRREIASRGGAAILLDSNWKKGDGVTSPLVVVPDNATKSQISAAKAYASEMAKLQKEVFGRDLKPRVVTRSENGRGRSNAFHTEGFAVTDSKFVDYMKSDAGRKRYSNILKNTLGKIRGAEFFLPHSSKDPGAVNRKLGVSEVSLASQILEDLGR